jgi:hypothetical protein
MPRPFPRPVEAAVRVLKNICNDSANSIALRARAAELILNAYGFSSLRLDEEPRHRSTKQIAAARVRISDLDKQISDRVKAERKQQKLAREIDQLTKEPND